MMTMNTDVLIIGAGPTGLSLACQMLRYGIDFAIVEKKEAITPYSKAIGVHARTLEIFDQIGLADEAVRQGTLAQSARLLIDGEVRGELKFGDVGRGMSPFPFVLMLEQSKTERLLYDYVQNHQKEVLWKTELQSFSQDASGVVAQVDWQFRHDTLHVCFSPDSFVVFFPLKGEKRYRIVGVFPEEFNKDEGD